MRLFRTIVVLSLLAVSARAAVVPRLTLEQLTAQADLIVHATVLSSRCAWDDSHRFIWTHYSLDVADVLKASAPARITVSVPGGGVGDTGMRVSGAVSFSPGEEVVVFLSRNALGYLASTGLAQGKYSVTIDPQSPGKRIRGGLGDVLLVDRPGSFPLPRRATSLDTLDGMALDDFKSLVRGLLLEGAP